jgi:DNA (cytosine-5)-methyltransferase 1
VPVSTPFLFQRLPDVVEQSSTDRIRGLDLFAGIGGLSAGFAEEGFRMTGVDSEIVANAVYRTAGFGQAVQHNLGTSLFEGGEFAVVLGGPPCRPWSPVNLQKRGIAHPDYGLMARFVEHVQAILPEVFVMENVPALGGDDTYAQGRRGFAAAGYDVHAALLHYDRFGSATRRRRLFTVGVRKSRHGAREFFRLLEAQHRPARTVWDAIHKYRDAGRSEAPDHDWSELRSIHKYRDRYSSGQYGWRKLEYQEPAPSFGSVAKTYILHPEAGDEGYPERVVSVREVLAIMGFDERVRFPEKTSRARRYQMVANAVSPQASRAAAAAVWQLLTTDSSIGFDTTAVASTESRPSPNSRTTIQLLPL